MKITQTQLLSFRSVNSTYPSSDKKNVISIEGYKDIDNTVSRGSKPNEAQLHQLKNAGVSAIIDFSTGYQSSNPDTEENLVRELGMEYVRIPFASFENPTPEQINTFFDTVNNAKRSNQKVFIHCTHGKDRTGLFSAMYKLKNNLCNFDEAKAEMLSMGHDSVNNPNLLPFLEKWYNEEQSCAQQLATCTCASCKIGNKSDKVEFINKFLNEKDPTESARLLLERYPELTWLTGDVNATPEGKSNADKSASKNLFGQQHAELDRTLVGINCFKQVYTGDYEGFTACQKEQVKLSRENFNALRDFTRSVIQTTDDIDAILAYTVINDLGKVKNFAELVGIDDNLEGKDHDEILLMGLRQSPEKFPSFDRLSIKHKSDILNALNTSFNLAQFVQGECLPGNLVNLKNMSKDAQNLYLVHIFYDVAGAAGQFVPNGSAVMTNPVYANYKDGIDVITNGQDMSAKEIYDTFLQIKAEGLGLPFATEHDKAIVRLAIMGRGSNPKDAEAVLRALDNLSDDDRSALINGLSKDGINEPAAFLYYSPALIVNATSAKEFSKEEMLTKAYQVLSMVYQNTKIPSDKMIHMVNVGNIAKAIKDEPGLSVEQLIEKL